IFYVGEKPWHGIGTELANPATSKEAIMASRLDYNITLQDIFLSNGEQIEGAKATVREDNGKSLGLVTGKYKIIQNVECFEFFDSVVAEKLAMYHTAGALGDGERIWILAKLPDNIIIAGVDEVEKYLLLTNSHDGKSALSMFFTPVRVVCQNTLSMSLRDKGNGISIRHMGNIQGKVDEARKVLGITIDFYKLLEQEGNALADRKVNSEEVNKYFDKVLGLEGKEIDEISTRSDNIKGRLKNLFENGEGHQQPAIKHSAWTMYNAVTQYVDHERTVKGLQKNPANKLNSIWLGSGANMKAKAYKEALELVNA
ncbi:hypothetical protein LCGC14_2825570, partial [marine sediment metagenome]